MFQQFSRVVAESRRGFVVLDTRIHWTHPASARAEIPEIDTAAAKTQRTAISPASGNHTSWAGQLADI